MGRKKIRKKERRGRRVSRQQVADASAADSSGKRSGVRGGGGSPRAGAAAALSESTSMWPSFLAALLIFLVASPVVVGPYGQKNGYTPDLHMSAYVQVGAMVVLSLFWISTFFRKRMQIAFPHSPVLLPLLVFYAWAMLSVLWADSKHEAVGNALDWSGAFLCGLLVLLLLRDAKQLKALLFFLLVSGLLMALLGIGQYLFAVDWVQQHIVPSATLSNKNMAGQYGVLTLPIAVMFFLRSEVPWKTWFFAVVISLLLAYIFYARSRGVLISLLAEAVVLFGLLAYFKFKHGSRLLGSMPVKKVALAASLALFAGLAYLTPAMFGNAEAVLENSLDSEPVELLSEHGGEVLEHVLKYEESADKRLAIWGNSIPMFKDHFLIGVGLGNWTTHYAAHQSWFKPDLVLMSGKYHANAHNDYIEILCELGIIGFALFVWVVVSLFRTGGRLLSDCDEQSFFLALPLITAVGGIAVNAIFSFPLKQPVPVLMLLVYIAMLSNLYGVIKGRERVFRLPPVPVRGVVAATVTFATVGLFVLQHNWYRSEVHYRNAVLSLEKQQYKDAYDEAVLSHDFYPLRNDLLWLRTQHLVGSDDLEERETGIETLKEALRVNPYSSSHLLNLASAYKVAGLPQDEFAVFRRLVEMQPINFPVKRHYAFLLLAIDKPEEALKAIELYRRNWQYDWELAGREIQLEEERMKRPDYTEGEGFQSWKNRRRNKGVRLTQIDRYVERVKRRIKEGMSLSEDAF